MQKVRFVNPAGGEVNIGLSPPYLFEKIAGIGAEDAQLMTSEPAAIDGQTFHGCYFGDREITVTFHIWGKTRSEMYANRQKLIALLSSEQYRTGASGRLYYTNDYISVWIPAVVKRGPQNADRVGNYNKSVQIIFFCPNHLFRGTDESTERTAYLDGGLSFPLEIDTVNKVSYGLRGYETGVYNAGDSPAPLSISITGPSVQPEIVKVSTGEFVRVKRVLNAGDILLINTTPGNLQATIQRAGGAVESAFGYLDLTSTFFQLSPGDNKLRYLSGDDTKTSVIVLSSFARYGGV